MTEPEQAQVFFGGTVMEFLQDACGYGLDWTDYAERWMAGCDEMMGHRAAVHSFLQTPLPHHTW